MRLQIQSFSFDVETYWAPNQLHRGGFANCTAISALILRSSRSHGNWCSKIRVANLTDIAAPCSSSHPSSCMDRTFFTDIPEKNISSFFIDSQFLRIYLGLKVTASFDRSESYTRVIDGQVRCITPEIKPQNLQVIWNVQFITVFVPAWMISPVYHSLRRESIKNASSASEIGVQSVRPTWFFFPSNAFMASARSLHMFHRSKKMNCNYHARLSTCR